MNTQNSWRRMSEASTSNVKVLLVIRSGCCSQRRWQSGFEATALGPGQSGAGVGRATTCLIWGSDDPDPAQQSPAWNTFLLRVPVPHFEPHASSFSDGLPYEVSSS